MSRLEGRAQPGMGALEIALIPPGLAEPERLLVIPEGNLRSRFPAVLSPNGHNGVGNGQGKTEPKQETSSRRLIHFLHLLDFTGIQKINL